MLIELIYSRSCSIDRISSLGFASACRRRLASSDCSAIVSGDREGSRDRGVSVVDGLGVDFDDTWEDWIFLKEDMIVWFYRQEKGCF